jgi:conjugal transfer ATP-binding protein TraC
MSEAAVQDCVDLSAIEAGVARFGRGRRAHSVAVLDIFAADSSLATADASTQEEILAGRAQFLNAQTAPFQVLVRAEPVDLEGHIRRLQGRVSQLPKQLADVARDYVSFTTSVAHQRTLLERRCFVILPDSAGAGATAWQRLSRAVSRRLVGRRERGETDTTDDVSVELARRLTARCDLVGRHLGRSGLRTQRLDSRALAELLRRCWSPDLARVQRLRDEIGAYTTTAVGGVLTTQGAHSTPREAEVEANPKGTSSVDDRLLALGSRTLADLVAPDSFEVRSDHVRLDGQYARVLAVTSYPRLVTPGWLSVLVESDLPIEVCVHVRPLASADMVRSLSLQVARLQSSRLAQLRGERVADPEREIALDDAERLRERLQRGDERLFAVSLYLLVRARTRRDLDLLTRRLEEQLDALLAHSRRALWEQRHGFESCLPAARDLLLVPRNLDTSALAATLPFVGPSMAMEGGMLFGVATRTQAPVILDPFDQSLDNANLVVVAPAGAGKSFTVKLLALRQLVNGVDCIVIDPEDEYRPIAEAIDGQIVRLAASSSHQLNPFDLPTLSGSSVDPGLATDDEDVLAERVTALHGVLEVMLCGSKTAAESGSLDAHERAVLDRALYQTYARLGITREPSTHSRRPPLLRDLHETLAAAPGEIAGSLAVRLQRYVNGSLSAGLFAGPTNVALDRSFVVFQTRGLAEELQPLAIHLIAGWVWNRIRHNRRPRLLLIDEAWSLLRYPEGGAFLASMARRARKYYLGLGTITQKVTDLADGGNGDTILANAAIVLLLKQKAETIDVAADRFRLTAEERQLLLGAAKGEGLLLVRGSRTPIQILSSPAEYRLATTSPRDLEQFAAEAQFERGTTSTPHSNKGRSASIALGDVFADRRVRRAKRTRLNGATP